MMGGTVCWLRAGIVGVIAVLGCVLPGVAQDEKEPDDKPRITAIAPLELASGATTTLYIRGAQLTEATELRFADAPAIAVQLKEKKHANVPNGANAKAVGDTQVVAEIKVPASFVREKARFRIVTPKGETDWQEVRLLPADTVIEEKEPDNGFREAQPLTRGKLLRGTIKEDKDVDVFRIEGKRGERLLVEAFAARGNSLLDPILTFFDEHGRLLASNDDADESRDALIEAVLPSDGIYYVSVMDAHDRASAWHAYTLEIKEAQP